MIKDWSPDDEMLEHVKSTEEYKDKEVLLECQQDLVGTPNTQPKIAKVSWFKIKYGAVCSGHENQAPIIKMKQFN